MFAIIVLSSRGITHEDEQNKLVLHYGTFGSVYNINYTCYTKPNFLFVKMLSVTEYGAGNVVSTNGDIYSYGILVLETVTGKRPTDSIFRQGLSLRDYVEQALRHSMMDVVDARLENELQTVDDSSSKRKIDCLISLLRLGMSCSQEMPSSRMSTRDIIKELHAIKESLL